MPPTLAGIALLLVAGPDRWHWPGGEGTRRWLAIAAVGIGGYVLYTLSSMTSSLDFLTWLSPWRWYVDDVMLINGLTWDVTLPFITATLCLLIGWQAFLHRDLQSS